MLNQSERLFLRKIYCGRNSTPGSGIHRFPSLIRKNRMHPKWAINPRGYGPSPRPIGPTSQHSGMFPSPADCSQTALRLLCGTRWYWLPGARRQLLIKPPLPMESPRVLGYLNVWTVNTDSLLIPVVTDENSDVVQGERMPSSKKFPGSFNMTFLVNTLLAFL